MKPVLPVVLIAVCAALGVALAVQRSTLNETRHELDQLQARLDRMEARQKESAAKKAVEDLQDQVAKVERKAAAAATAAEAVSSRPAPKGDAPAPAVAFTEEDIQKIVDAKVEEKLQKKKEDKKFGEDDRKMPLFELAKELTLDPAVQQRIASIANTAKKEIFDILKTPRPDGSNAADDVITAFTSGDTEGAKKIFLKLFTEKIPGTDTPYVTAVARVQEKANTALSAAMGSQAYGKFQGMSIKPENIETGFDPWADYLQQRGK